MAAAKGDRDSIQPQWSPVMKTGNTPRRGRHPLHAGRASMEPGHEDREYWGAVLQGALRRLASMEPGHEDREYPPARAADATPKPGLNGARS